MRFNYKALDKNNKIVQGEAESFDRFTLARELRDQGLNTILSVQLMSVSGHGRLPVFIQGLFTHISLRDKILFATNVSSMIKAGLPLTRAISVVERQASNRNFKAVLRGLISRVERGKSLSQSLRDYPNVFPAIFGAMVAAGEESGNLSEALNIVGIQLNKTYELRRKIRGAMLYPIIVIAAIIIVAVLLMVYLVPILSSTFAGLNVALPLSTRLMIFASDVIAGHTVLLLLIFCFLVLGFVVFSKSTHGRFIWQAFWLKVPVIGDLVRKANAAVTMRTISSLISAGVGMVDALIITEDVLQNVHYKKILVDASKKVGAGDSLSTTFNEQPYFYPVLVGEMVAVGEETGSLSEMLLKGAVFYEDEVDQATKNLSTVIEPVLMIVVGAAVGFFAIAIISPIYSLVNFI